MTREEMNDIKENASEFVTGLFCFSSLVVKALTLFEAFKARKKQNDKENKTMVEEKDN